MFTRQERLPICKNGVETISKEQKVLCNLKVRTIPEKNRKIQKSEALKQIIEKEKIQAERINDFKMKTLYKCNCRNMLLRFKKLSGTQIVKWNSRQVLQNLNVVIRRNEVNDYKEDAMKQYKAENSPIYFDFDIKDYEKKFGKYEECHPDESILEEIISMKSRGL